MRDGGSNYKHDRIHGLAVAMIVPTEERCRS
jgi:hypothetical protein